MPTIFRCPNCDTSFQITHLPASSNGNSASDSASATNGASPAAGLRFQFLEGNFQAMSKKARELGGTYDGKAKIWTMPTLATAEQLDTILSKYSDNRFEKF